MKPERSTSDDQLGDGELLDRVARRSEDPRRARDAESIFYRRHVRYLYGVLLRHKRNLLAIAGLSAEDLVHETFHRAFDRARTFSIDPALDDERQRQRVSAWLGRIAQNLLVDHLEKHREVSASPWLEEVGVTTAGLDEELPPSQSPMARLIAEGLDQLTERERDVLRVSALYYRAGDHQRLPNDVSAELAGRWETTNENIRAIRVRAMKKLKAYVEERRVTIGAR